MTARQKRLKDWSEAVKGYSFTKGECEESLNQLKEVYNSAPLDERKWCRIDLETKGLKPSTIL